MPSQLEVRKIPDPGSRPHLPKCMASPTDTSIDNLTGDSPQLAIPSGVRAAANRAIDSGRAQHYTPRAGLDALREAIVVHLERQERGRVLADDLVMVSGGQTESLFLAIETLVSTGDEVVAIGEVPETTQPVVALAGGKLRHIPHYSSLERRGRGATGGAPEPRSVGLILINNSGSAGQAWTGVALEHLAAIASDLDVPVLALEDGIELTPSAVGHLSAAACPGLRSRTLRVGGFLAWGLDSWRIGYITGPAAMVAPMTNLKQGLSICAPALSQYAALAAIQDYSEWSTVAAEELAARRNLAWEILRGSRLSLKQVESGWTYVGRCDPPGESPFLLGFLRSEARVIVSDATRVAGSGAVQITLCQPVPSLKASLQRMKESLGRL